MAIVGGVADRSSVGALLKRVYDKDLQLSIQNETPFLKYAQKKSWPLDGEDFYIAVHLTRNAAGTQNTDIGDDLPNSGTPGVAQGKLRAKRIFQAFQIDNELIKLADRAPATFSERVDIIYTDAKQTMLKVVERQLLGDGQATLATCSTFAGGTTPQTITVDDTRFIEEGQRIQIRNTSSNALVPPSGGSAQDDYFTVSSIDSATTLTIASSIAANVPAITSGWTLVPYQARTSTVAGSKEFNGMRLICDNASDFMGIAYATYRRWRGNIVDAAGAAFNPGLVSQAIVQARQISHMKDKPNVIYTHPVQAHAFIYGNNGTFPDIRYTHGTLDKAKVSQSPTFNIDGQDIQVETALDMQKSDLFMFRSDALLFGELSAPGLESFGEISILPAASSTTGRVVAAQRGWYSWRGELGCFRRNAFSWVKNLAVPF